MASRNTIPFSLPGFAIDDDVHEEDGWLRITAHATAETALCPDCATPSRRVHSYYTRSPCDLPCIGRAVRLVLRVRRFRCRNPQCTRKTFAERLPTVVARYARRTARLTAALRAVGFRMSSEAGAGVLKHLQVHISADTLLRLLRRTSLEPETTPRVLGIDDWAKWKGHTYGTVLVDLERHHVVGLLPERESEAVAQWLKAHPGVEIICRDRAEVYAEGAAQGAPNAVQVADRWHLAKNLGEALQRLLERHLPALRAAARQMHDRTILPAPAPAEAAPGEQTSAAVSKTSTPTSWRKPPNPSSWCTTTPATTPPPKSGASFKTMPTALPSSICPATRRTTTRLSSGGARLSAAPPTTVISRTSPCWSAPSMRLWPTSPLILSRSRHCLVSISTIWLSRSRWQLSPERFLKNYTIPAESQK